MFRSLFAKVESRTARAAAHRARGRADVAAAVAEARAAGRPVLCNLGCGSRYHPAWINIDFHGVNAAVHEWDLRGGFPLPDDCADAVYSSHVIEHFDRPAASGFLDECRRVLKPGGVLRVVAPDLEGIARGYLDCLDAARRGETGAADRHEWMILELVDQLARHHGGGEMLRHWSQQTVPEEEFVVSRIGVGYLKARAECRGGEFPERPSTAEDVGRFRLGGEVHQWMYDSFSLGRLLRDRGFVEVMPTDARTSAIPGFVDHHLDTNDDGTVYKPDSLYIEAKAP